MTNLFKHKKTYFYLIPGIVMLVIGYLISLNYNPFSVALYFIGPIFIVVSFTYGLKKSSSFLILLFSSIGCFILFGILLNLLEAMAEGEFLMGVNVVFFYLWKFLIPSGIIVGTVGFIVKQIQEEKGKFGLLPNSQK